MSAGIVGHCRRVQVQMQIAFHDHDHDHGIYEYLVSASTAQYSMIQYDIDELVRLEH